MTKILDEVTELAQPADAREVVVNGVDNDEEADVGLVLQYLAPWLEKTDGVESIGNWEVTLATRMMVKIMELWLTLESRAQVERMMEWYHPLDRAAMAYALVVYVMTGRRMKFRNGAANQHYRMICQMLKDDMPTLMFAGHMKYMIRRYGPKRNR